MATSLGQVRGQGVVDLVDAVLALPGDEAHPRAVVVDAQLAPVAVSVSCGPSRIGGSVHVMPCTP